jgi:phospholipid/cholesterol/gamma-HCH transport system ATP-binding protein
MMNSTLEAATTPAIEFRHVSISFGELQVLRDISFTLYRNEMLFVTGASGSGKSILLRLAMGILRPDDGQIFIQGREITALEEEELLDIRGKELGLVFQDEALFTDRDVYDNAAYRLVEHDWPLDKVDAEVREILGFVGLDHDLEKEVFELSGGMKRRLELARAIVGWPPIMLFDEPTTGLDPINAQQVRDMIIRARDLHRMSSIYVSKAMHEIDYLVSHYARRNDNGTIEMLKAETGSQAQTRALVLDEGVIAFLGSYDQFCQSSLPAIIRLLRPQPSATNPSFHPLDPWSKERKSDHEIF